MNDIWKTAGVRAALTGLVLGAQAAVVMWSQTDDAKSIAIAFLGAFLTVLVTRLGLEGAIDNRRAEASSPAPAPEP